MTYQLSDNLTVFFVARYGITSVKARILALSARRHLPEDVKLRLSIPKNYIQPDRETIDLMEGLNIEVKEFMPRLAMVKGEQYLKIDASMQAFETSRALYLDPDMIFIDASNFDDLPAKARISARISPKQNYFEPDMTRQLRIFLQSIDPARPFRNIGTDPEQDPEEMMPFTLYKPTAVLFDTTSNFANEWRDLAWRLEISRLPGKIKNIADRIALSYLIDRDHESFLPLPTGWNENSHPNHKGKGHRKLVQYFQMAALLQCKSILEEARSLHVEADESGMPCFNELTSWDLKMLLDKL